MPEQVKEMLKHVRGEPPMILSKIIAIIFILFIICFIAIIIEETFIGGRKRRRLEKQAREKAAGPPS